MRRYIKSLPLAALYEGLCAFWLGFIYTNSLKNTADSAAQSAPMEDLLRRLLAALGFEGDGEWMAELVVRKAAHMFEFFVLTLLLYLLLRALGYSAGEGLLRAAVFAVAAAAADETLQLYSGRGAKVGDVFIDSLGVSVAVIIARSAKIFNKLCL